MDRLDTTNASTPSSPEPSALVLGAEAAGIELDEEKAAQRKLRSLYQLNVIRIPLMRCVGFLFLSFGILYYNRFLGDPLDNQGLPLYCWIVTFYVLGSWLLLRLFYDPRSRFDLGILFLSCDLLFQIWAIYLTGGEASWLVILLVFRTADQSNTSFRRALLFAHLAPLAFLLLTGYLAWWEQRTLSWPAELTKTVLLYLGNIYIALSVRGADLSRRKVAQSVRMARQLIQQLEEQSASLRQAKQQAEAANEAKGHFLANMSHEIRTPIGNILSLSELLSREELDDRVRSHMEVLGSSAEGLLDLVDEVLDFSKVEAGKFELVEAPFELTIGVQRIVTPLAPKAATKGLELRTDLSPDLPRHVVGDLARLRQVLLNLVGNAIKFTESGEVVLSVEPDDSALDPRGGEGLPILFTVRDTGIGLPETMRDHLFEPFFQADNSSSRRFGGTGLGLAISKQLVQLMGGEIGFEAGPGRGAVFWCRIPFEIAHTAQSAAQVPPPRRIPDESRKSSTSVASWWPKTTRSISWSSNTSCTTSASPPSS